MKTIRLCLFIFGSGVLLCSCTKEYSREGANTTPSGNGGNNTTSILGTYDFVGITGNTSTTVNVNQAGQQLRSVGTSSYASTGNSGTVEIAETDFIFSDITYSIHTTATTETFLNNVSMGKADVPFDLDSPASSSTETYEKNTEDSLTFPNPVLITPTNVNGTINPTPMGAITSWSGDTLLLKIVYPFTGNAVQSGIPATFSGMLNGVIKLKKR